MKKFIKKYKTNLILGLISVVALIIGSLAINFVTAFIIVLIIDTLLFLLPLIMNKINKKKSSKVNKKANQVSKTTYNTNIEPRQNLVRSRSKVATTKSANINNGRPKVVSNTKNNVSRSSNTSRINPKTANSKTSQPSQTETKKKTQTSTPTSKKTTTSQTNANKTNQPKKKKRFKWLKVLLIIFFAMCLLVIVCGCLFLAYIVKSAPEFDPDQLYTKESSILYDSDGKEYQKLGSQNREKITYDELPEVLIDAIIATEDSRFFQHNGFDFPRFIKASIGQLTGNGAAGGASTITMQVIKNTYTDADKDDMDVEGIIRKFTDIYMAIFKLEKKYSKEQILEFYVNSYYMGGGAWGVEQVSINYFGKSAKDLTLPEASLIAGLFQSPNSYNPFLHPEAATKRRSTVLKLMERHGYITEEERVAAEAIPIESLLTKKTEEEVKYQAFIDVVAEEVEKKTGNNPYVVPMLIYTTMNRAKQDYINSIMNGQNWYWENDKVQAGISVIDTKTGAIIALGSGRNYSGDNRIDFAVHMKKQIGSTAKPLYDYGPAIEYNNWSTYNLLGDEPYHYSSGQEIYNWDAGYQGLITARTALAGSRNIPALKTFQQVNNKNIKTFVTNLGLSPEDPVHEAHAIGGYNGESPLSMSAAYAAFANGGYYNEPHSYTKIIYRDTGEEVENTYVKRRAMSEETAYMVNDMLITTASEALGYYSYINGYRYAAKTGTTNFTDEIKRQNGLPDDAINDYWVIGTTDEYSIGVWYGYNSISNQAYNHFGTSNHTSIFQRIASGIWTRSTNVPKPAGVVSVTVERETNPAQLPSAYTPNDMKVTELFKSGTEPTSVSTRFAQLSNPTNVSSSYANGTVTLSWTNIKTPDALNKNKLLELAKMSFTTSGYQESYVNWRLNYNNNVLGELGYDIYVKGKNSALTYAGTSKSNTFKYNIASTAEPITFVIKTAYAKFKSNASSGVETTVKFTGSEPIITATLNGDEKISKNRGEVYSDEGVTVYDNLVDVTSQAEISITIKDSNNRILGSNMSSIDFNVVGTYTVTYNVKYRTLNKQFTRIIIVQ